MSDNAVSPVLSMIEERIKQLKQLKRDMDTIKSDIQSHENTIEALYLKRDELNADIVHVHDRIHYLCEQAIIRDGFTKEYIRQFLKERGYQL